MLSKVREENGATYNNWEIGLARAETTAGTKKIGMSGKFSINLLKNAYKYSDEVQLQLYSPNFDFEERSKANNGKWNRTEIFLSPKQINDLIIALGMALNRLQEEKR